MDETKNEAPFRVTLEGADRLEDRPVRVDFWTDRPVSDLIAEAGARPVENARDLQLAGVSEAEWEALYEALGIGR